MSIKLDNEVVSSNETTLQQKERLSEQYFSSDSQVDDVLKVFREKLVSRDPNTTILKTSAGSTGHTYKCSISAKKLARENPAVMLDFILKWQPEAQCSVELLGTQLFQSHGHKAPNIYYRGSSKAIEIVDSAKKVNEKLKSQVDELPLIVMPKIEGGNLGDLIQNGQLKKLPKEDVEHLIEQYGEIAAMDLLIGNDDRFLRFTDDPDQPFYPGTSLNPGNVMMQLKSEGDSYRLMNVYPIDSCPAPVFVDKEKVEEMEELGFSWMEDDEWENEVEEPEPLVLHNDSATDTEKKRKGFHKVFKEIHHDKTALCKEFDEKLRVELRSHGENLEEYQEFFSAIPTHFSRGLENGFEKIKENGEIPALIRKELPGIEHERELIEKNLKTLTGERV